MDFFFHDLFVLQPDSDRVYLMDGKIRGIGSKRKAFFEMAINQ